MNARDERTLQPPPECCQQCAHMTEWHGTTGDRHDCLRGYPMHSNCGWFSPKTGTLINGARRIP